MPVAFALAVGDRACGGRRGAPGLRIIGGGDQARAAVFGSRTSAISPTVTTAVTPASTSKVAA